MISNKMRNLYKKYRISRYILFLLGMLIYAVGFNLFLLPNSIVFGGLGGIAIIFQEVFNWTPALFMFIASLVLLLISLFLLGKQITIASTLGSILLPIIIQLTSKISELIVIDSSHLLLTSMFGGVLCGVGIGLTYKAGFTTGGTDIFNKIINKYMHLSMGKAITITDGVIITSGAFLFGLTKTMYAIIVLYIISSLVDKVVLGISDKKAFYIITSKDEEVKDFVINRLGHGVTIFKVKGGFKGKNDQILFCVIPTGEYFKLKDGINKIDSSAFFVITDAYEVYGGE